MNVAKRMEKGIQKNQAQKSLLIELFAGIYRFYSFFSIPKRLFMPSIKDDDDVFDR